MRRVGTAEPQVPGTASAQAPRSLRLIRSLLVPGPPSRLELLALLLLLAAFVVVWAWASRIPTLLQHDESVYAVLARHWQSGTPNTGVAAHRAPLLPVLGIPVLAIGGGEIGLRAWGLVAGLGAAVAVWWLGRMIAGAVAGLVAASVFVFAPTVLRASTQFLTDLPAAAVLLGLAGVLWWQFAVRDAPDHRLHLAALLAWAAYHFRYGSALVVVLLLLTTAAFFWPTVRAHARLVAQMIGLLVVLLVPHLVNSTLDMGTPWERLLYTSWIAGRDYLGQGLVEYARWFPWRLAGPAAAALMATGLLGGGLVLVGRRGSRPASDKTTARALLFLIVPALAHIVAIGIASHGEPRFVFFAVALLCIAGATVTVLVLRWLVGVHQALVWTALVLFGLVVVTHAAVLARYESRQRSTEMRNHELLQVTAEHIVAASGPECSILTSYTPQFTWYTGCPSYHFGDPPGVGRERHLTGDGWMVLFQDGKRQPEGEILASYLEFFEPAGSWDAHDGEKGTADLYRLVEPPP